MICQQPVKLGVVARTPFFQYRLDLGVRRSAPAVARSAVDRVVEKYGVGAPIGVEHGEDPAPEPGPKAHAAQNYGDPHGELSQVTVECERTALRCDHSTA